MVLHSLSRQCLMLALMFSDQQAMYFFAFNSGSFKMLGFSFNKDLNIQLFDVLTLVTRTDDKRLFFFLFFVFLFFALLEDGSFRTCRVLCDAKVQVYNACSQS